jgi:facilitated trehalose transporter
MKEKEELLTPLSPISPPVKKIKSESNPYAIVVAYHLGILQQLSGIQIIIIYTGDIVLKIWPSIEKTLPILIHGLGAMACYLTMWLIGHYGRKELIQKGTLILIVFSFMFVGCFIWKNNAETDHGDVAFFPSMILILGFIIFRATFSATLGPVVWLYLP